MLLPITAEYIFDVPGVSQPCLSDDGSAVAFVKTTIDRGKMERESRIIIARRPFDELSDLTAGPKDSAPFVDKDRVLFLRPDDNDKKQVWSIPLSGGDAACITNLPGGVEEFSVSPSGYEIAVVSTVDPDASEEEEEAEAAPRPSRQSHPLPTRRARIPRRRFSAIVRCGCRVGACPPDNGRRRR